MQLVITVDIIPIFNIRFDNEHEPCWFEAQRIDIFYH